MLQPVASSNPAPLTEMEEVRRVLSGISPLNDPRLMVQVGASDGGLAMGFVKRGWRAIALDAAPMYRQSEVDAEAAANPNFRFLNRAVTWKDAPTVPFFPADGLPTLNSLWRTHPDQQEVVVPAITLKALYAQEGVTTIDFFMIDAEGFDLHIMQSHDWSVPIGALMMEVSPKNVRRIYDFVMTQRPDYEHVVFRWEKREPKYGIFGEMTGLADVGDMESAPQNGRVFGNILFYA